MLSTLFVSLALAHPSLAPVEPTAPVLDGDLTHGQQLLVEKKVSVPVNGSWLNAFSNDDALDRLARGRDGFPHIDGNNVLDRWDVLATLRSKNTRLTDLGFAATHVLVSDVKLDDNAVARLRERGGIDLGDAPASRAMRVFTLFQLDGPHVPGHLVHVAGHDPKKRDALRRERKVGYVVFVPVTGDDGAPREVAFAIDKDIHIRRVVVRASDGSVPADLNQLANGWIGKGQRGRYDKVVAATKGKGLATWSDSLSRAFLIGTEAIYAFEAAEREHFAFGD